MGDLARKGSHFPYCARQIPVQALILAMLAGLSGCGDAGEPTAAASANADVDAAFGNPFNGITADGADGSAEIARSSDSGIETGTDGGIGDAKTGDSFVTTTNCDFAAQPKSGESGASCTGPADCDSSYCIEGPAGKICTKTCSACCPQGYGCEAASATDPQFICIAKLNALCRPCEKDTDCNKLSPGALCIGYGASGHFCGGNCTADADCYSGHACQDAKGSDGAGKQCIKTTGECSCSPPMILDGAKTTCSAVNTVGSCQGSRKCAASGLTACDAPTPATETCDGLDNNCDGATDEANAMDCKEFYQDKDNDGFGKLATTAKCMCKPADLFTATTASDCDDDNPKVKPGLVDDCNGIDDDCDGVVDPGFPDTDADGSADCVDPDIDNDGTANAADCAPANVNISPTVTETCNDIDDNCNGAIDEAAASGCKMLYTDVDGDGFGKAVDGEKAPCLCKASGTNSATVAGDCDDTLAAVNPSAVEQCNDKDDNCDAKTDEGCDDDKDGVCDGKLVVVGIPVVCPQGGKDCDDSNSAISPVAKEICATSIDENCDGATDSGTDAKDCVNFFKDADKDGFGGGQAQCLCAADGAFSATNNKDCNDNSALQSPAKPEICNNSLDDNCDGNQDEPDAVACQPYYTDPDGDGYGAADQACLCGPSQSHTTTKSGDCQPNNPQIGPGATEICNGIDDNCKNGVDETDSKGCVVYFADEDQDGIGNTKLSKCLCKSAAPYTATANGDCDDTKASSKPGALETCDGVDNDCNGKTDEIGADGCKTVYIDKDGDKFGSPASAACLCALGGDYNATKGGDCNDGDQGIFPGAQEFCDGQDNNCSTSVDEENAIGCIQYLKDSDKDAFGVSGSGKCLCKPLYPYTEFTGGDCDDTVATVNPKIAEICDNVDNNCDGQTDPAGSDGCSPFYLDKDTDGYGTVLAAPKCLCDAKSPYTTAVAGDCNDNDPKSYPKATEYCDGKDTDCDGIVDPKGAQGCKAYFLDLDSDGWGGNAISQCLCNADAPFSTTKTGDCNDNAASVYPDATEMCNTVDDNCNGQTDESAQGTQQFYLDNDGDGYGTGTPINACAAKAPYSATKAGDCNDGNSAVNPGMTEVACNGLDDNCDGVSNGQAFVYSIDFNSGAAGWTKGGLNPLWALANKSGGTSPTAFPSMAYGTPNQGPLGKEQSWLQSPVFNLTGGGTVKFDSWISNENSPLDLEQIQISFNGGASWVNVGTPQDGYWLLQKKWQGLVVTVPATLGSATTALRLYYDTVDGSTTFGPLDQAGWFIDNFVAQSTCK